MKVQTQGGVGELAGILTNGLKDSSSVSGLTIDCHGIMRSWENNDDHDGGTEGNDDKNSNNDDGDDGVEQVHTNRHQSQEM